MKNYLVTDLSSLCGLRAPSKSNGGKEPRWGEEGAPPSVQYLGALENYIQLDCMAHPEAICETVFLICFMFLNVGKPLSLTLFKKLPPSPGGSLKIITLPWLP